MPRESSSAIPRCSIHGTTPRTGRLRRFSMKSTPGENRPRSPRNLFTMNPATRPRSADSSSSIVPTSEAKTPPRSMSATRMTGAETARATRMLTISVAFRFTSTGLPAPSITTRSYSPSNAHRLRSTTGHSSSRWRWYSAAFIVPSTLPETTTCERASPSGLSKIGFMAMDANTPAASACAA